MEKQSDSLESQNKAHSRPVFVLTRFEPVNTHFESAKKLLADWKEELKQVASCIDMDVICCVPEQIAWIEHWDSKAGLDLFNKEQLPFSPFTAAFFEHSRAVPMRHVYRKLQ